MHRASQGLWRLFCEIIRHSGHLLLLLRERAKREWREWEIIYSLEAAEPTFEDSILYRRLKHDPSGELFVFSKTESKNKTFRRNQMKSVHGDCISLAVFHQHLQIEQLSTRVRGAGLFLRLCLLRVAQEKAQR